MNDQILQTPNTMRILNPYRYGTTPEDILDNLVTSLSPKAWYEARKESYSDTNAVSVMHDWSGNSYDITQATPGNRATFISSGINSKPTFRFDGNDYYTGSFWSSSQPITAVIVLKDDDLDTTTRWAFDGNNATNRVSFVRSNVWNAYAGVFKALGVNDSSPHIITLFYSGASSLYKIDNGSDITGTPGTNSMSAITIGSLYDGSSSFWDGDISALYIWDSDKTASLASLRTAINDVYNTY